MKTAGVLLLLGLALCCILDIDAQKVGKGYCGGFVEPSDFCTLEYEPHCGSDGKTYSNRCFFCNAYLRSGGTLRLKYLGEC